MSSILQQKAAEYLQAQIAVIPTLADKRPAVTGWTDFQKTRLTLAELDQLYRGEAIRPHVENSSGQKVGIKLSASPAGLGILAGEISGGLEIIDVDVKYDTTGTLWAELWELIESNLPDISADLVIAQTKSGGYHIYYRCSTISGNLKLAVKKNKEVLVETRGEGGYVVAPPTPGYTYTQGDPTRIPTITPQHRETLFYIAKSFTEAEEAQPKTPAPPAGTKSTGLSPFEDYNERGDVVALLEAKGWKVVNKSGDRINLLRPGETDSTTSGNFHTKKRVLRVFSSSTAFDPDKGYSAGQVFSLLECEGDHKEAYKRLLELGYGEPYMEPSDQPKQLSTRQIKVEAVNQINSVNQVTSVISEPGSVLRAEDIATSGAPAVLINSPGPQAVEEVLRAIALIQKTGKRIYVKEQDLELREYEYSLQYVFSKYDTIQEEQGQLSARDKDSLLDEVIQIALPLQPLDRDLFTKAFLELEPIQELGITAESLEETLRRLAETRDKEAQQKALQSLLSKATELQDSGETSKALELLEKKVLEVKLQDKATEFSALLVPTSEDEIRRAISNAPDSLKTGYKIEQEDLELPSGALTVFVGPTSHGKTSLLINLLLETAKNYPDKKFLFFSYEESAEAIYLKALNTYANLTLSKNNRKSLQSYYKGQEQYIQKDSIDYLHRTRTEFFSQLVNTGRIKIVYSNYDSDTLISAIRHLNKTAEIGGIFIDYFQLLNLPEKRMSNYASRQQELKEICQNLKDTAVDTGLPVILGAQFNREVTDPRKIHATRIGEAGDIERIANQIVGFWNTEFTPAFDKSGSELTKVNQELGLNLGAKPGKLHAVLLKARDGQQGLTTLWDWAGNTGKVSNRTTEKGPF
jgi:replicative DNA helicase